MAMVTDEKALFWSTWSPDIGRGRVSRRLGFAADFIPPPTDTNVEKFRRFSAETSPDPLSINGKAYHHKVWHTGLEPATNTNVAKFRRISSETSPSISVLNGKAFHHKILRFTAPVEGGNVDTNIQYNISPPSPLLNGKAFHHKVLNTGFSLTDTNVEKFHRFSKETFPHPQSIAGSVKRNRIFHTGLEPATDVNVNKFRRISKQVFPDPQSISGTAKHRKIMHFSPILVEGGNVDTNITFETTPPHPVLNGKAFHHKISHITETVNIEGGNVDTNITFETIPPHPVLNAFARHHRIFHTGEEFEHLIHLLSRNIISQFPDPQSINGKAFHHKIFHVEPPTDVNINKFRKLSKEITPDPLSINGKAYHHKVMLAPPPPPSVDRVFERRTSRQPEPNLGLLFKTQTTQRTSEKADSPNYVLFTHTYQHSYRVADAALGLFQLYVGEDAEPDFTAPPQQTSATLPFSLAITPPGVGTKTINAVVRQQNEYGLASFNIHKTNFVIDTAGNEVLGPITPPVITLLTQGRLGFAIATAEYIGDDINPADKWELYAKEGIDPIPGTDTPVATGEMLFIGPIAIFRGTLGTFTPGATLHVIATALRDVDSTRGNSLVSQIVLNLSPDLDEGTAFGGNIKELR